MLLFFSGAILFAGFSNAVLFVLRRDERASGYLSLACFAFVINLLLPNTSGIPLHHLLPWLDLALSFRLDLRQKVQVTATEFVCKYSDDEGTDNTSDMELFGVAVKSYSHAKSTDSLVLIDSKTVYHFSNQIITMNSGTQHNVDQSVILTFDTENYNYSLSELHIKAEAQDDDSPNFLNEDDYASGEIKLIANKFLENGGKHSITLTNNGNFLIEANVTLKLLD